MRDLVREALDAASVGARRPAIDDQVAQLDVEVELGRAWRQQRVLGGSGRSGLRPEGWSSARPGWCWARIPDTLSM